MSASRPPLPRLLAALGAAALLAATTACEGDQPSKTGSAEGVAHAASELLAWRGVTAEATLAATPQEVAAYLRHVGGEEPSAATAGRLADMEVTTTTGSQDPAASLWDMDDDEPLDSAMTVSFGGNDAVGVKRIADQSYARTDVVTIVSDGYDGDAAAVAAAERFVADAARLPDSLSVARGALTGRWVAVDPHRYSEYAAAVASGTGAEHEVAADIAGALAGANRLLAPVSGGGFVGSLVDAMQDSATYRDAGRERGADLVTVRMPAGRAWQALEPLLDYFTAQGEAFGLPRLFAEPVGSAARAEVTGELSVRNGVLSGVSFDLAQFAPAGTAAPSDTDADAEPGERVTPPPPPLPLSVALTGGTGLSLLPPSDQRLTPQDLTVALLYLAQDER